MLVAVSVILNDKLCNAEKCVNKTCKSDVKFNQHL